MSTQSDLLREVADVVSGKRNKDYGSPKINLDERTAKMWTAYLKANEDIFYKYGFRGVDVCNMMILVKMARTIENATVKDNWADMAGYAAAAWDIIEEEKYDDAVF
jgi:hypothetical protein